MGAMAGGIVLWSCSVIFERGVYRSSNCSVLCEPKCGAKQVGGDVFVLWFERLDCLGWSGRRS